MCGIIGYVGRREAKPLLLAGLERLEYRGYDSAGIALLENGAFERVRAVGNLAKLRERAGETESAATTGIGHTRWATHGRVTEENAHPFLSNDGRLSLVLNGIVENYRELRERLAARGHVFTSETDAEVVCHLLAELDDGDLGATVRRAYGLLRGHFAFVVCHADRPDLLVGARLACPLVIGVGESEGFLASMIGAFLPETRSVVALEDGEVVELTPEGVHIFDAESGEDVDREPYEPDLETEEADSGSFGSFMLKEIHEQPRALEATIDAHLSGGRLALDLGAATTSYRLSRFEHVVVLACGTAYHAGLAAAFAFEEWAGLPTDVAVASEWRYRRNLVGERTLVLAISQSGETADTLAAVRSAREAGAHVVALTNMPGSQITRDADSSLFTRCGIEMGVAATKTFTSQVVLLQLVALRLAEAREALSPVQVAHLVCELARLPGRVRSFLGGTHPIEQIAERHADARFFFFLGRHAGYPVCLEGALKLKEISYIPCEAYPAGEMKHGPIALLDETTPVVCVAYGSHVSDKLASNIEEVRARGAQVIAIATDGDEEMQYLADSVVYVPRTHPLLMPVVAALPLQLLAYHVSRQLGLNVDQPRNLAKTVTVE